MKDSLFRGCVENPFGQCRVQLSATHAVLISGDIDTSFTPLWWCDLEMTPNVSKCEQASDVSGWVSGSRPVASWVGFQPTSFVSSHFLLQIVASHLCLALVSFPHSHRMNTFFNISRCIEWNINIKCLIFLAVQRGFTVGNDFLNETNVSLYLHITSNYSCRKLSKQ